MYALKNAVFWDVTLCDLVGSRHFGGTCCPHLQDRRSTTLYSSALKMETARSSETLIDICMYQTIQCTGHPLNYCNSMFVWSSWLNSAFFSTIILSLKSGYQPSVWGLKILTFQRNMLSPTSGGSSEILVFIHKTTWGHNTEEHILTNTAMKTSKLT
jgi:hypothetical protein